MDCTKLVVLNWNLISDPRGESGCGVHHGDGLEALHKSHL